MGLRFLSLLLLAGLATGCVNMKPEDYAGREPRLLLEDYFAAENDKLERLTGIRF